MRLLRRRLGHGTLAAYLALFLALAGGAVAAATIDSGDVINGSLKSVDLKNGAGVKGADVVNGSLAGGDVRNGALKGANVTNDSLGGADVNEPSLVLSQTFASLGGAVNAALPMGASVPCRMAPTPSPQIAATSTSAAARSRSRRLVSSRGTPSSICCLMGPPCRRRTLPVWSRSSTTTRARPRGHSPSGYSRGLEGWPRFAPASRSIISST